MYPDSDDSDSDRDHVLHAVDRYRRPPAPHHVLPVHYPLAGGGGRYDNARTRCLCDWMIVPQAILCSCILLSGGFSIYCALQPDERPGTGFIWLIVFCAVIMVSTLLSLLLSYLGIYVYDDCMY